MSDADLVLDADALLLPGESRDEAPAPSHSPGRPGPGLPESLTWVFATIVFQVIASVVVVVLLMLMQAAQNPRGIQEIAEDMEKLPPDQLLLLIGLPALLAYLVLIPTGLLRMRSGAAGKLNLALPSPTQTAVLIATILPLTFIADALFRLADLGWQALIESVPLLRPFEAMNVMEALEKVESANLLGLILFIAAVPAIGEEFVFRGLIGRGLVARWGVPVGIAITSVLFAVVHMYPPHVAAVLPIGVVMHLVYLSTRSFWAPMLFHFLNNTMACVALSLGKADEQASTHPLLLAAAAAHVALSLLFLWRGRTQYLDAAGRPCSPGYVSVQVPPPELDAQRRAPVSWLAIVVSLVLLAGWIVVMISEE